MAASLSALVTPFSQYVKNLAMFNIMQLSRVRTLDHDCDIWDMIWAKPANYPVLLSLQSALAKEQGREFYTGDPQALYPDQLDEFKKEMQANGWELGKDNEELFELAMHPEQYRAYKSGKAKADFEVELAQAKAQKSATGAQLQPETVTVEVNGEKYVVNIAYGDTSDSADSKTSQAAQTSTVSGEAHEVVSPLEGKFYLTNNPVTLPLN